MSVLFAATYPDRDVGARPRRCGRANDSGRPTIPWGAREEDYRAEPGANRDARPRAPRGCRSELLRDSPEPRRGGTPSLCELDTSFERAREQRLALVRMNMDYRRSAGAPGDPSPNARAQPHRRHSGRREVARAISPRTSLGRGTSRSPGSDHAVFDRRPEPYHRRDRIVPERNMGGARLGESGGPERVLATVSSPTSSTRPHAPPSSGMRAGVSSFVAHHRARAGGGLTRFRGTQIDTAGDGFFASFDGPARAIRCACAISGGRARARHRDSRRAAHRRVRADRPEGGRYRRQHRRARSRRGRGRRSARIEHGQGSRRRVGH